MRRKLLFVLFTLLGSTILTALDNPNVNQFTVRSDKGNVFSVNQNISTVFEQLGEPDSKKNMWAEYPNASCAYYNVESIIMLCSLMFIIKSIQFVITVLGLEALIQKS